MDLPTSRCGKSNFTSNGDTNSHNSDGAQSDSSNGDRSRKSKLETIVSEPSSPKKESDTSKKSACSEPNSLQSSSPKKLATGSPSVAPSPHDSSRKTTHKSIGSSGDNARDSNASVGEQNATTHQLNQASQKLTASKSAPVSSRFAVPLDIYQICCPPKRRPKITQRYTDVHALPTCRGTKHDAYGANFSTIATSSYYCDYLSSSFAETSVTRHLNRYISCLRSNTHAASCDRLPLPYDPAYFRSLFTPSDCKQPCNCQDSSDAFVICHTQPQPAENPCAPKPQKKMKCTFQSKPSKRPDCKYYQPKSLMKSKCPCELQRVTSASKCPQESKSACFHTRHCIQPPIKRGMCTRKVSRKETREPYTVQILPPPPQEPTTAKDKVSSESSTKMSKSKSPKISAQKKAKIGGGATAESADVAPDSKVKAKSPQAKVETPQHHSAVSYAHKFSSLSQDPCARMTDPLFYKFYKANCLNIEYAACPNTKKYVNWCPSKSGSGQASPTVTPVNSQQWMQFDQQWDD